MYGLLQAKNEQTFDHTNLKLFKLEPELFHHEICKKAVMKTLENIFNSSDLVVSSS